MPNSARKLISSDKAEAYDSFFEVFSHLYKELKALGSKKPAETLSESKVKIVNRLLEDMRKIMEEEPEYKYLDMLDSEMLPQYSDAILILSQYEGALKGFKERYFGYDEYKHKHQWNIG
ncbi:hypothetical protein [Paraglaciecola sp.]|uniref:hypothetical protein n=1 Tax=Paraglaciecola sp. TaxID=1920173 RepID=UPI003EF441A6